MGNLETIVADAPCQKGLTRRIYNAFDRWLYFEAGAVNSAIFATYAGISEYASSGNMADAAKALATRTAASFLVGGPITRAITYFGKKIENHAAAQIAFNLLPSAFFVYIGIRGMQEAGISPYPAMLLDTIAQPLINGHFVNKAYYGEDTVLSRVARSIKNMAKKVYGLISQKQEY